MKCPKCGYLGFEHLERCRNCGYDFSLSAPLDAPELPLRSKAAPIAPLDDLDLLDNVAPVRAAAPLADVGSDLDRLLGVPASPRPPQILTADLPLFGEEPLIRKPSPPRPPLSVRRATPEVPKLRVDAPRPQPARVEPREAALDLSLDADPVSTPAGEATDAADATDAGVAQRLTAVAIDLLILAAIDAAVIYFTLQICGITVRDLGIVPKVPLLAFLLVQNGGYLVAFTAGGQTLGKMAVGIRVVSDEAGAGLDLGRACLRTAMWLLLAVPAGLGFLTALVAPDHRGLHDRLARTRVVR